MSFNPLILAIIANAMPKLPEVLSIKCVFSVIKPCLIPCSMMYLAGRSFMLPPGFIYSNFANTSCFGNS
ncbi:Uncharacterised protein [Staphylococcus aureus]|nr:Uncharacterised protein [Staphylococcus aureus]